MRPESKDRPGQEAVQQEHNQLTICQLMWYIQMHQILAQEHGNNENKCMIYSLHR